MSQLTDLPKLEFRAPTTIAVRPDVLPTLEILERVNAIAATAFKAGVGSRKFSNQSAVATAILRGLELGIKPITALEYFDFHNGMLSVRTKHALALVRASGLLASKDERIDGLNGNQSGWVAICTLERVGGEKVTYRWSWKDVERSGVLKCKNPEDSAWAKYPQDMLRFKALGRALFDLFGDVLGGVSLSDFDDESASISSVKSRDNGGVSVVGASSLACSDRVSVCDSNQTQAITESPTVVIAPPKKENSDLDTARTECRDLIAELTGIFPLGGLSDLVNAAKKEAGIDAKIGEVTDLNRLRLLTKILKHELSQRLDPVTVAREYYQVASHLGERYGDKAATLVTHLLARFQVDRVEIEAMKDGLLARPDIVRSASKLVASMSAILQGEATVEEVIGIDVTAESL